MEEIRKFILYYYDKFNDIYNYLFEKDPERLIKKKIIEDYNESLKFFDGLGISIARGGGFVTLLNEIQIDEYIKSFTDEIKIRESLNKKNIDPFYDIKPLAKYNKIFDLKGLDSESDSDSDSDSDSESESESESKPDSSSLKKRKPDSESPDMTSDKRRRKLNPKPSWTEIPKPEDKDEDKDEDFIPKEKFDNQISYPSGLTIHINPDTDVAVSNSFYDVRYDETDFLIYKGHNENTFRFIEDLKLKKFVFKVCYYNLIVSHSHIYSVYVDFEKKCYIPIDTLDIERFTERSPPILNFLEFFFGSKGLTLVPIKLKYDLQEAEKLGLCQLWTSFFCFYLYYYDIDKVKEMYKEFTKLDKNFYKVILLTWAYNNISALRSGRFYFNKLSKKKVKSLKKSNSKKKVKSLKTNSKKKLKSLKKSDSKKKVKSLKKSDSKKKVKSLKKSNSKKKVKSLKKSNSGKKVKSLKKSDSKKKVKSLKKSDSKKKVKSLKKSDSKKKVKSLKKSDSEKKVKSLKKSDSKKKVKSLKKSDSKKKVKSLKKK
jgi:hypothetical protein